MRYVVYLRVSTDQQADTGQGLDIQEAACRAWLRAGQHRLVEVCTDAGRSGSANVGDRAGLARALAVATSKQADGMLVYRLDRLARDMVLQETLLAELHRRGGELRSCSPTEDAHLADDPEDPTRALVRRILGALAGYEREMIRIRLRAGRDRKRLAGGYAGGGLGYGWKSVDGEAVRVPEEQAAIQLMCRLRDQQWSYRRILAELNRRGIPSRAPHGQWRANTILDIIARERDKKRVAGKAPLPSPELVEANA